MRKKHTNSLILADSVFRELLLQYPHLLPIADALHLKGPYSNQTVRQICKLNNLHESVIVLVLEACVSAEMPVIDSLPSYGLLQLCDLTQVVCEQLIQQLEQLSVKPEVESLLMLLLDELRKHRAELIEVMVPHTYKIYELYYSPEYTSHKRDILKYSIEFFPKVTLPSALMTELEEKCEVLFGWQEMVAMHRFSTHMKVVERIEMFLIRQVVLKLEYEIVTSIQKKKIKPVRKTYLSFSEDNLTHEILSPRELEVLKLVAVGFLNKEIADQLNISLNTVISHRKHIVSKLGITTLAGLAVYAYTHGYLMDSNFSEEN